MSLALGSFASVTAEVLPVGVLPEVAKTFGVSVGSAGLMITLPSILAALSAPGVLFLVGRADRRHILLLLSAILLAACLLSVWAQTFPLMLLSRAMVGTSLGAFWAMALAVAVRLVAAEKAHKATAAVLAGVTAGMILGVPLGTLVAEYYSWRGAFAVVAAIAALALLMQAWAMPPVPASDVMRISSLVKFLQRTASRKSMLMIAMVFAAQFGTYTYVTPLMQQAGINASNITLILLGYGLTGFVANFVAGHVIGRNLQVSLLATKALLFVSLAVLPWLIKLPLAESTLILLWGIAWGALPLCLITWNFSVSGGDTEAASAMFTFTTQVAIAIGSAIGGYIMDHLGIRTTFTVGAAVVLLSAILLVAYNPPRR